MRAHLAGQPEQKVICNQSPVATTQPAEKPVPSIADKVSQTRSVRRRKKASRKKGGWPTSKGLIWKGEVCRIYALQKLAADAGVPLNWFISIRPPADILALPENRIKRWLCNQAKGIQQRVCGRRTYRQDKPPCVTVYEKNRGGPLHCHLLIHVTAGNPALEGLGDGVVVRAERANLKFHLGYITKQRRPLGDREFEQSFWHKRTNSDAITGVRVSFNGVAKSLLAGVEQANLAKARAA